MSDAPFEPFALAGDVRRFTGKSGWYHLPFPAEVGDPLRPLVTAHWPALLKVTARIDHVEWTATVMPVKDGPLFIALPAKIRKTLDVDEGDAVTVHITPIPRE